MLISPPVLGWPCIASTNSIARSRPQRGVLQQQQLGIRCSLNTCPCAANIVRADYLLCRVSYGRSVAQMLTQRRSHGLLGGSSSGRGSLRTLGNVRGSDLVRL
jgi:GTP cyclohydrolase FolE2